MSSNGASSHALDGEPCRIRPVPTLPLLKLPDLSENLLERRRNAEYRLLAVVNRGS